MRVIKNNLNEKNNSSLSQDIEGGGEKKSCNIVENISQKIKNVTSPEGEDLVKKQYELEKIFESENPRVINPVKYRTVEDLCIAIKHHWIHRLYRKESTIDKRLRRITAMENHPVFPIDFLNFNPNQAILYLDYRYTVERATPNAIKNDWKVICTFAKAFGMDIMKWNYVPPPELKPKVKIIPLPPTVHKIIHHKYSKDPYECALYQYILMGSFIIGMRMVSEITSIRVSDVFLDDGYIIIREAKKYNQLRQIFPEKEILTMDKRKSYKNWIDKWRPKVVNQYSKDFLFLQPNGRPLVNEHLRQKLSTLGKSVWPDYKPNISRSWCAIARLIKSKIEFGYYDVYEIKEYLGHDKLKTTDSYIQFARNYYRIAPYDWIKAILKSDIMKNVIVSEGITA
jgi:integrase